MSSTPLQQALQAAPERPTVGNAAPEEEFFCFAVGELRLGVASEFVQEVVRIGPLTPLPRVPPFVLGVCGHRGQVLPVLDLLRFLGKGETRISAKARLFIATSSGYVTGVVAEQVLGLVRIPREAIVPAPLGGDQANEHLIGVVRPGRREETLSLLNFPKVLGAARQRAVAR